MKGTTAGQHSFAQIPKAEIQRSSFNRSSGLKTAFDGGKLVPIFADEALPGDTFNLRMSTFARMATPANPILDNLYLDSFFFAVPIRLIWENWERMNGQQDDPTDTTSYLVPQITTPKGSGPEGKLSDHLGIPIIDSGSTALTHSVLWHRAYNLIWNEWFRDQNLQDSVVVDQDDALATYADYEELLPRGKRHDYFTSCLPWPVKDIVGASPPLIISGTAPVTVFSDTATDEQPTFTASAGGGSTVNLAGLDGSTAASWTADPDVTGSMEWVLPKLAGTADLSSATANSINELREAFQIQRVYERDARGGSRYTEIIRSHFGVSSDDARLQRPEYLGGGSQPMNVTPVPRTAGATPGGLSAFGVSQGSGHSFTKSFTEHCVIIGLISVRADLNYQSGLARQFSRRSRFDFYWPALANLGEQAVLAKEIFAGESTDDDVFGYQERYAEYRYKASEVHGIMRSIAGNSLDVWHLAQDFQSLPTLNATFIEDNPPIDRVILTSGEKQVLFDAFFDLKCARPMPTYSVPGMIDHF